MDFAILRIVKLKSLQQIGRAAAHNLRDHDTTAPTANPLRRPLNRVVVGPPDRRRVISAFKNRLAEAPTARSDAVKALEIVMTASKQFFDKQSEKGIQAWMDQSVDWARETWGNENVISIVLHRDEETPHLQALIVPMQEKKLRASHWLDGPKKMAGLQDSYAKAVSNLGLRRGVPRKRVQHTHLADFYQFARRIAISQRRLSRTHKQIVLPDFDELVSLERGLYEELREAVSRSERERAELTAQAAFGKQLAASMIGPEMRRRLQEGADLAVELKNRCDAGRLEYREIEEEIRILKLQRESDDESCIESRRELNRLRAEVEKVQSDLIRAQELRLAEERQLESMQAQAEALSRMQQRGG